MHIQLERLWQALAQSREDDARDESRLAAAQPGPACLPAIWLLGKTGAGKSSLVRALTGLDATRIGDGFRPCTRCTLELDFPAERPVMRFLDTRGLGEPGYDPAEDLGQCERASHVLLAVARLDDPVQGELADALAAVRRRRPETPIIVVHSGADLLPGEQERFRARAQTQGRFEKAVGGMLPWVEVALPPTAPSLETADGVDQLVDLLDAIMPEVALLLAREEFRSAERARFADLRAEVLWYAGAAGASDIAPLVGAISVPSIQAAMLRRLGRRFGVPWTRARLGEFAVALGLGAALRFGGNYAARQAAKLIPVYGQSAGAAAAGTLSFASTFALGRAAAYYLHRVQAGEPVAGEELRAIYKDALKRARRGRP